MASPLLNIGLGDGGTVQKRGDMDSITIVSHRSSAWRLAQGWNATRPNSKIKGGIGQRFNSIWKVWTIEQMNETCTHDDGFATSGAMRSYPGE